MYRGLGARCDGRVCDSRAQGYVLHSRSRSSGSSLDQHLCEAVRVGIGALGKQQPERYVNIHRESLVWSTVVSGHSAFEFRHSSMD